MKIRELYIKNFGKFSDKRILLEDGINLFYGENESGKSTTHTFIKSMLFGLERGRGRASVNDTFSLYEPWENPNYYAGTLRFESGGKHFCLQRNFDKYSKDASLICEDDGEEFSIEHGDLEMILGGLTASNYDNTVAIAQMQVETNQTLAIELQNYATNYYSAGNGCISGVDYKENTTTQYPVGDFKEGANTQLRNILSRLGFETQIDEKGKVTTSSDIPYPAVKRAKFAQIYNKAKEKIQGAFTKLKALVNSKDQDKEKDTNERK